MTTQGQITNIDLLKKNLSAAENDTIRVELLNTMGSHYIGRDSVYCIHYLSQARDLAKQISYSKGLADNYLYLGRFYYYLDHYELSRENYQFAQELYQVIGDSTGLAGYFFSMAELYRILGDYKQAIEHYQLSSQLREQLGDKRGLSICLVGLGRIHYHQLNYSLALQYYNEALLYKKQVEDHQGIATVLSNIGEVYENQGKYDQALEYHLRALQIRDSLGEKRRIAISLQKVGDILSQSGALDSAAALYGKANQIYVVLNERTGLIGNLLRQARLFIRAQNYEKARNKGIEALRISEELGNSNFVKACCRVLHQVYSHLGDYETAYDYLNRFNELYVQISSETNQRTIADLEVRYQVAEKDQEIDLLNSRNKIQNQRMVIFITSISAILLGLILLFVVLRFKLISLKQNNILLKKEKEIQARKVELKEKEKQSLAENLELQNRELASKALLMNQTAETVQNNTEALKRVVLQCGNGNRGVQKEIEAIIRNFETFTTTNLWDDFELAFKNVHTGFYDNLLSACPDLSRTEIKIAALLRLNLTTKEIEAITFKSESGIKSIRYRLRKKLNLDSDQGLTAFLMQL